MVSIKVVERDDGKKILLTIKDGGIQVFRSEPYSRRRLLELRLKYIVLRRVIFLAAWLVALLIAGLFLVCTVALIKIIWQALP